MSKKPSFANLGTRLAQKTAAASSMQSSEEAQTLPDRTAQDDTIRRLRQPDGRRGILVRARPEAWKALKQVALDGERTLQDVMTEAINDILTKNGKSPVA